MDIPFTIVSLERCAHLESISIVKDVPKKQKWEDHNPEAIERILPMIRPFMVELC